MKVYSAVDRIPKAEANFDLLEGCMVLEGGAWRGIYTEGVLDVLMAEGFNMTSTIGVSAGAMNGIGYVAGQIGRAARINLTYRHDRNYVGLGAMAKDHGITGFSYFFDHMSDTEPMNRERFYDSRRSFTVVATDCETGEATYFDREHPEFFKAIQASATVPYVSAPVVIDGRKYLDGGIAAKIPMDWVMEKDFDKIIVVRTRDRSYRKPVKRPLHLVKREYRNYPNLVKDLNEEAPRYNLLLDEIDRLEEKGRIFVIAPSRPITISRFESDVEKLGDLYWQGYYDAIEALPKLREYMKSSRVE